ncbi:phage tail tip fiber protein, partial [Pseudomonas fontis]
PPAVTHLTTKPLVYGIGLDWGFPAGAEDTQRTEIWYSKNTSRDDAIKLSDFAHPQSNHMLQLGAAGLEFFFWARLVDRSGNIGPWHPTGIGIKGRSSSDQSEYEEYFKEKIGNGALLPVLRGEIDLISGPPTMPGSVSARLKAVNDQLQEQIDAIGDVVDALEYDPAKAYASGENVRQGQRLYVAIQNVPLGNAPPNPAYWLDIGQVARTENGSAARVTLVETKVTEQDGKLTAQAKRIDGVQSSLGDKADASAVQVLSNTVSQQGDTLSSQGRALTVLTNRVGDAEGVGSAQAQAISQLDTAVTQQGTKLAAQASRLDGLFVQVNPEMEGDTSGMAGEQGGMVGVWTEQSVRVEDGMAIGKKVETVQAQIGETNASVQMLSEVTASVDGKVSAISSWKTETNSHGKKVATGIVQGSNGDEGEILLMAQRLAIIDGLDGQMTLPFVVQGGQVFMNSTVIRQADILNLIITGVLRSGDYVPGQAGIMLNFVSGQFELNGSSPGQGRSVISNRSIRFWGPNNQKRIQLGDQTE